MLTGGFNAEYGQAVSGVVKVSTKEGNDRVEGKASFKLSASGETVALLDSREQLIEALDIALVVGGSIVIPHLRRTYEILDELGLKSEQACYLGDDLPDVAVIGAVGLGVAVADAAEAAAAAAARADRTAASRPRRGCGRRRQ